MEPASSSLGRALVLRERERASRKRRRVRLEAMRATAAALECSLPVILTLGKDREDVHWEGFLDETGMRRRRLFLQSLELTKEATRLRKSQVEIERLLHEHRLTARVLNGLLATNTIDDWEASVHRWRELARRHFRPWRLEDCEAEVRTALREIELFRKKEAHTTRASFLGWRDLRRVDTVHGVLQFQLNKIFRDDDMDQFVDRVWETYSNPHCFGDVIIGPRARSSHLILQRIGGDMMIVMAGHQIPAISAHALTVFLLFRVQIQGVVTVCSRSIRCPKMLAEIHKPTDLWASNYAWTQWEPLADSDIPGYVFRTGGSIGGIDVHHANLWMWEIFAAVLRAERFAKGRDLITCS